MTTVAADRTARAGELVDEAFDSFCDDIAGMFGVDMRCERREMSQQSVKGLLAHFKKLAVVHVVQGRGTVEGEFRLLFDHGGLFILSGVVVMLPEARILEEVKRGSADSVERLKDPAQEVGNLLVGAWDRVFRARCEGHKHFIKTSTCIGKPLENPGLIGLTADTEVLVALYEMTVEPYPSFTCAAVFPQTLLNGLASGDDGADEAVNVSKPEPAAPKASAPATGASSPSSGNATPESPSDGRLPERPSQVKAAVDVRQSNSPVSERDDEPRRVETVAQPMDLGMPGTPHSEAKSGGSTRGADETSVRPGPTDQDQGISEVLRKTAAQIMEKKVIWASPEETVQDVIAKMQQHNCGYVLVGDTKTIEGLVSKSNVLGAVSLYLRPLFARWRRPEDDATLGVKIKWIMSRPVRTIRPDATLTAMIECMHAFGGRCLPVVDERGSVQGIVTVFDMLLHILEADKSFAWKGGSPQTPALMI